jgi:hypothetical protein
MPTLSVLVSAQNEVLGTFQAGNGNGAGAPSQIGFQVSPGQRVIQVDIDNATALLGAEALHDKIKADFLGTA